MNQHIVPDRGRSFNLVTGPPTALVLMLILSGSGCDSNAWFDYREPQRNKGRSITPSGNSIDTGIPEDGLLAFYPFDRTTEDVGPGRHYGNAVGTSFVPDRFGSPESAVYFNGTDAFVDLTNSHQLQVELPISISYWVNLEQKEQTQAAFTNNFNAKSNSGVFATFDSRGANPAFSFANGGPPGSSSRRTKHARLSLVKNRWYHLVGVIAGRDDIAIYVDGAEVDGFFDGSANWLSYAPGPAVFGRRTASSGQPPLYFRGILDEFAIYERALTAEDVQLLFHAGRTGS